MCFIVQFGSGNELCLMIFDVPCVFLVLGSWNVSIIFIETVVALRPIFCN